ncbi:MAG TPA: DUF5615 family PIN-like protein [Candidatus Wunengus sp. YC63]|uniref:DUF5615 family PIN-like protein n=1 Tax=unclassified Candidatus Wunengus TaxID=3367695 RepID=UPI00271238F3|nr:DUF5615 family PIN-like protein [Candidatus Brocadiales bacterium]
MKIVSLKLLTDENISPQVVAFLRQKGIDIVDVKEKGWCGNEDKYLMGIARKEKRFILTHDVDFGTLAINEGIPCYGIIYMRLKNIKVSNIITILEKLLAIDKDVEVGSLIVVEDTRVRVRNITQ